MMNLVYLYIIINLKIYNRKYYSSYIKSEIENIKNKYKKE